MLSIRHISLGLITCVGLLTSCSGGQNRAREAVPRPVAYPRLAAIDSLYVTIDNLPVNLQANAATQVHRKDASWIDIVYPDYAATVYVTVSKVPADSIDAVMENRWQRMKLNIATPTGVEVEAYESGKFTSSLIVSPTTVTTPLQFLATDNQGCVVSGTVFFVNVKPDAPIDSLAPAVSAITRDMRHMLKNIGL